jgi:hypothetical protein
MEFCIGADPEVFVGNNLGVRSIVGLIGGTKYMPRPLLELGNGFAVQEDNVALEYNIPVSMTREAFTDNIELAMKFLEATIHDMHGLQFVKESAVSFPDDQLQTPASKEFGCEPDYNAWTLKRNPRPKTDDKNLRSCGGHVHIGVDLPSKQKIKLVRACDLYMGVGSVLMDSEGAKRRMLYGKPGAYREKKYGVEYRTLSNFWVFDKRLTGWVYDQTKAALDAVLNEVPFEEDGQFIQDSINNNDKELANFLVEKYHLNILNV